MTVGKRLEKMNVLIQTQPPFATLPLLRCFPLGDVCHMTGAFQKVRLDLHQEARKGKRRGGACGKRPV